MSSDGQDKWRLQCQPYSPSARCSSQKLLWPPYVWVYFCKLGYLSCLLGCWGEKRICHTLVLVDVVLLVLEVEGWVSDWAGGNDLTKTCMVTQSLLRRMDLVLVMWGIGTAGQWWWAPSSPWPSPWTWPGSSSPQEVTIQRRQFQLQSKDREGF